MKFRLHPLLLTNIFLGIFSLVVTSAVADNAKKPYWQDVQVVAVNKEYPRSSFMTYDNREAVSYTHLDVYKRQVIDRIQRYYL